MLIEISTNENTKPIKIGYRLNAQFANNTLSRFHVCEWHQSLKNVLEEDETRLSNMEWCIERENGLLKQEPTLTN